MKRRITRCFFCGDPIDGPPCILGNDSEKEDTRLTLLAKYGPYPETEPFAITPARVFCSRECKTQYVEIALKEYGAKLDAELDRGEE